MTTDIHAATQASRESFEAWWTNGQDGNPESIRRCGDGYFWADADHAWEVWQAATQARDAEIAALKEDAERYRVLKEKIRPIYRPGHPRIELYIDGQTIAWHATTDSDRSYSESIDAAIDDARKDGAR